MKKLLKKIKKFFKRVRYYLIEKTKRRPFEFGIHLYGNDGLIFKAINEKEKKFIYKGKSIKFCGSHFEYSIDELKSIIKKHDEGFFDNYMGV